MVHRCSPRYPLHIVPVLATSSTSSCTGAHHVMWRVSFTWPYRESGAQLVSKHIQETRRAGGKKQGGLMAWLANYVNDLIEVGPGIYCSPCHLTHFEPSFLESLGARHEPFH